MLKPKTFYKHDCNQDVYMYVDTIYLSDENIAIYDIEWYNINNYFVALDRIKIKHEDKHRWKEHKHEGKIQAY